MKTLEVVRAYKSLAFVERAFRNLKTVQLEIRPVYHKTDERIRSHVFLCMLAYYLQWHMEQRLAPLFANDGKGEDRRWTFRGVIDCLAQITPHIPHLFYRHIAIFSRKKAARLTQFCHGNLSC